MKAIIDKVTERETKKGNTYTNFNLAIDFEWEAASVKLYVIGCQIMGGFINLPSYRSGRSWVPNIYIDTPIAELIYDTVSGAGHELQDRDVVVNALVLRGSEFARLFPNS